MNLPPKYITDDDTGASGDLSNVPSAAVDLFFFAFGKEGKITCGYKCEV